MLEVEFHYLVVRNFEDLPFDCFWFGDFDHPDSEFDSGPGPGPDFDSDCDSGYVDCASTENISRLDWTS